MSENSTPVLPAQRHHAGLVGLVGRPNAGKSTLLNKVLGQKIAITSPKPQTTRNRVVGIHTQPDMQVVLVDTPGLHEPTSPLNRAMVQVARDALGEVDAICWLVDAQRAAARLAEGRQVVHAGIEAIGAMVEQAPAGAAGRLTLALNKIDLVAKPQLLPVIAALAQRFPDARIVPVSARTGDGVEPLLATWREQLPEGPAIYPEDQVTSHSERFVVAELIREKIFRLTQQEVPYSTAVEVEQFTEEAAEDPEERGRVVIFARILVERDSQKGIVIGKGGKMLKEIGIQARRDIRALLGARVHLELHVTVQPRWSSNPRTLRDMGIG